MPCVYSEKEAFWILFSPLLWFVWSAFPLSTRWLSTGSFRFAEDWYGWLVSLKQLSLKQQSREASKDHFCPVRCGFYKKIARLSLTNFAECALLKRFSPKRQNSYSLELRLARILEIQFGSDCWNLWDSSGSPCRLRQIVVLRPCFLLNALKLVKWIPDVLHLERVFSETGARKCLQSRYLERMMFKTKIIFLNKRHPSFPYCSLWTITYLQRKQEKTWGNVFRKVKLSWGLTSVTDERLGFSDQIIFTNLW